MEPQKKVLVSPDFLATEHGEIQCDTCHGGNPAAGEKEKAHTDLAPKPSMANPEGACGECHETITATAPDSLHATLAPFTTMLKSRADMAQWKTIDMGRERHCGYCHTGCGGCHVSRPENVDGGFVNGHLFNKRPDLLNQCIACHGSRVGNEYLGSRGRGDVHALKANMDCVDCHGAGEMHAAAPEGIRNRYHLKEQARCMDCHKDLQYGSIRDHTIHIGKVQCQVCHSQTYTNCYGCHTGVDKEGLPYYVTSEDVEGMKIGLNPEKNAPGADYDFMLVRHIPVDPKLFDHYAKDALTRYDDLPTWKRTSPHNISRKTWQTATCNHCHGSRSLYLSEADLLDYEKAANRGVVVPDARIPRPVSRTRALDIDVSRVKTGWVVDAEWLKNAMEEPGLVVLDVRSKPAYDAGHIPGAIYLDPLADLRWPWNTDSPQQLLDPDRIAAAFGEKGISDADHIVVYDGDAWRAAFTLSVLDYMGAPDISFLKGGIGAWRRAGHPMSAEAPDVRPRRFQAKPQSRFIVDNEYVAEHLDDPGVVIVDMRTLDQSRKLTKHPRASRAGRIPGSVKYPVYGLYMDHAELKPPERLLYALSTRGVTPDKTIVLTCNTGAWAGAGFFMLRRLGFPDVRMHDASWVGWERFVRRPDCRY
ncbi:MAG: hypothetical protein GY859_06650 [Desulfobacterales bacterium]|nr:hypothetical protein [Desulfobacterales bacterium]